MNERTSSRRVRWTLLTTCCALALSACGGDDDSSPAGDDAATTTQPSDGGDGGDTLPNACPVEGCEITILSAEKSGDEILLVFDANYTPDFERNHIHVFWDSQDPGAISSDFQERGFDVQGKWHPTDEYPDYTTQADASVSSEFRGESTTLCVTAADTDHAVIDPTIVDCRDVSELLT